MKSEFELGRIRKDMYDNAPSGEKVVMIHLFGVKYADEIKNNRIPSSLIIKESGIPYASYATEITKAVNLSKYVIPRT